MFWRTLTLVILAAAAGFYLGRHSQPASVSPRSTPNNGREILIPKPDPVPPPAAPIPALETAETAEAAVSDDQPLKISLPMSGLKMSDIQDTFGQARDGTRRHGATDIMAPRGTPVLAVNDGKIAKLFLSKPGGITIYQFDPSGQYCYYYAHLDRYAAGIAEGTIVHRGEIIAYVGSTGNANPSNPHLHFEIHRLGTDKHWYQGISLNPYPYLIKALRQ